MPNKHVPRRIADKKPPIAIRATVKLLSLSADLSADLSSDRLDQEIRSSVLGSPLLRCIGFISKLDGPNT